MEIDVDRLLVTGTMKTQQQTDNVFRLHLISTNNDMEVEKDVLYKEVFPKIQQICHHLGLVLQVIEDPPDDAFSHSTRKQDIDSSCQCTLALLGEKRNPVALPKVINAREFRVLMMTGEKLLEDSSVTDILPNLSPSIQLHLKEDMKSTLAFLQMHYKKDFNSVPPSFLLQPDHRSSLEKQFSNGTEFKHLGNFTLEKIIFCLQRIAREAHSSKSLTSEAAYKYVYPALTNFTQATKDNPNNTPHHVICIKRHFEDFEIERIQNVQSAEKFFDLLKLNGNIYWDDQNQRYLNELEKKFSCAESFLFYSVEWLGNGVNCNQHAQYVDRIRTGIRHKLTEVINKHKIRSTDENIEQHLIQEINHHSLQYENICTLFSGNPEILAQASKILEKQSLRLVLHGDVGSGKTFICGKIVEIFSELHGPSCVTLFRFLHPYHTSCQKRHVLESMCKQLYNIVHNKNKGYVELEPGPLSSPQEAMQCLLDMLAGINCPCLVVFDTIDSVYQGELLLTGFLDNLPNNVSCVLSVTSDNFLNNWLNSLNRENVQNAQLTALPFQPSESLGTMHKFSSGTICVAKVPSFERSTSVVTINRVLKQKNRCLEAYQRDQVMTVSSKFQNALFIELLANEACTWRSFDKSEWMNKLLTINDLLQKVFRMVEAYHGKKLVEQTLCYLTESRCGLSEFELVDILCRDSLLLKMYSQQRHGILSFAVKYLLGDIRHMLSATEEGTTMLLAWKHSCVADFIRENYLRNLKANIHTKLANYWINEACISCTTIADGTLDEISVTQQDLSDWCHQEVYSLRTLRELPYHLIHSGNQARFNDLHLNPDWICGKIQTLSPYAVTEDFELASQTWQGQGYGRIAEAFHLIADVGVVEECMQEFVHYLHPYCLCYAKTVGKLCDNITSWLARRDGNRYVISIGAQTSSGPLLAQVKHRASKVTISAKTNELFAVTEKGFLISYSLLSLKVKRMKRLFAFPSVDMYEKLEIHETSDGSHVLALYGSVLIGLFDVDSLECVKTIPYAKGSELSPNTEFVFSNRQGNIVIHSVSSEEDVFNSEVRSGQLRHLLFSKDDTYEIFEDIKSPNSPQQQCVIKVFNTTTGSVTALSEIVIPTGFQVKACSYELQCIVVGVVKTPKCSNQDFPKDIPSGLQRVQLFHLSTMSRTLDMKIPVLLSYLCCDSQGDQFIAGSENKGYVYGLPDGSQSCEIQCSGSEAVIIRGPRVIFYGNSSVKVFSSQSGNLLSRWETGADNPSEKYWLMDNGSHLVRHTFLDATGIVEVWKIPEGVNSQRQGNCADPSFQCLAYTPSSGLIVGTTEDGYMATMDTCRKAYRWRFSQVQIKHTIDKLVLSSDASIAVALGRGISVFDINAGKLTMRNDFENLRISDGRFVDAVFSDSNRRLTLVKNETSLRSVVLTLQLDAQDSSCATYKCIPERISLGRSKVMFLSETEASSGPGYTSTGRSYHMTALINDKLPKRLDIETMGNETVALCLSRDESKFALVCSGRIDDHNPTLTLSVKIFDADELRKISEYKERNCGSIDVKRAIFQGTHVIIFTSGKVLKLDLISGTFGEIVSFELQNAVTSKDDKFFVATSRSRDIYLVNINTSDVVVKCPIPVGMPTSFMANSHLDKLFLFTRGMTHPALLVANEQLRDVMLLDRISYDLPYYDSQLAADMVPCRIENISHILLSDFPDRTHDTSESTIMSISSTAEANIRSLELRIEGGSSTKTDQELENKAYFVKQTLNKGPLKTDTVRFSNGPSKGEIRSLKNNEQQNARHVFPIGEEAYVISSNMKVDNMDSVQEEASKVGKETDESKSHSESGSESEVYSNSDSESSGSSYSGSTSGSDHSESSTSTGMKTIESVGEQVSVGQSVLDNQSYQQEDDSLDTKGADMFSTEPRPTLGSNVETSAGMTADSTVTSSEVSGMAIKPVKQATSWNYFASSESDQEYDGGAEDNTLSDTESLSIYPSQKDSTMCSRTKGKTSEDDQSPSDGEELTTTKNSDISDQYGIPARVIAHRPTTCNYFMPSDDDREDNDGLDKLLKDREGKLLLDRNQRTNPSRDDRADVLLQKELIGLRKNVSGDAEARFLKDAKKDTSSKACALM